MSVVVNGGKFPFFIFFNAIVMVYFDRMELVISLKKERYIYLRHELYQHHVNGCVRFPEKVPKDRKSNTLHYL